MLINFSPIRMDEVLTLDVEGDVLTLNGVVFNFDKLLEGATLPQEAIMSDWFTGGVHRIAGDLHLTLRLPHGPNAPGSTRFPEPITVDKDGPVNLPIYDITPGPELVEATEDE